MDSFTKLSSYNSDAWIKLQTRAQKWPCSIFLSSFQVDKLTVISRWVLVKIVYGVEVNVNELSKDDVSRIVTEEICEDADPVELVPTKLVQSNQYPKWKKDMIGHLETLRTIKFDFHMVFVLLSA